MLRRHHILLLLLEWLILSLKSIVMYTAGHTCGIVIVYVDLVLWDDTISCFLGRYHHYPWTSGWWYLSFLLWSTCWCVIECLWYHRAIHILLIGFIVLWWFFDHHCRYWITNWIISTMLGLLLLLFLIGSYDGCSSTSPTTAAPSVDHSILLLLLCLLLSDNVFSRIVD